MKKDENAFFDIAMGSEGVEVRERVGSSLLGKLSNISKKNIGVYKDHRLSVTENANGSKLDRLKTEVIAIFHNEGLKITIDTNLTTADFLNVTLDLFSGKCYPYRKSNDRPFYVKAISNDPSTIFKQLLTMLNTRLLSLNTCL